MLRVGLTGGIGAGKSTVLAIFASLGAQTLSADAVAHDVLAAGSPGYAAVVEHFGDAIIGSDNEINRAALAEVVFGDATAREVLEAIVHPLVAQQTLAWLDSMGDDAIAIVEIPLLAEIGEERRAAYRLDVNLVVESSMDIAARRVMESRGMTQADFDRRAGAQASNTDRAAIGDYVIVNDGDVASLEVEVFAIWQVLRTLNAGGVAQVAE